MVFFTGAAVATVITGGVAAFPLAASIGGTAGASAATAATAGTVGTGVAMGTAVGIGTASGAIAGAGVAGTAAGAGIGAVAGGTSAAAVGYLGAGGGAIAATGGLGLLAVGTSVNSEDGRITYDCWKPVVHNRSTEPSSGMLLKDMICHPNVAKVTMTTGVTTGLPSIVIENIWNEMFEIQYLLLHKTGKIVCHAKPVDE